MKKSARLTAIPPRGVWFINPANLTLRWLGKQPAPRPTVKERLIFARLYLTDGISQPIIDSIKRLAKAVAFCLNPSQVPSSGKPYETTGLPIEEDWNNFNLNLCTPPHSGQGNSEILDAKSSNFN